ncbi:LytTR family transcriptional regulator, partial [Lacticaseibacillus rhamnosus]
MQPDDLLVYVKDAHLSPAVLQILQQIQQLADSHSTLPLLVGERVIVLPTTEIVAIEVYGDQLS